MVQTLYDECCYSYPEIFLEIVFKKNIFHEKDSRAGITIMFRNTLHLETNNFILAVIDRIHKENEVVSVIKSRNDIGKAANNVKIEYRHNQSPLFFVTRQL